MAKLTPEKALQFATMLQAGLPANEAIVYFAEEGETAEDLAYKLQDWTRSAALKRAMASLMRKPWQDMTPNERYEAGLEIHYSGLAYFLYSHNYADLGSSDKAKADTARQALEAKLAGTSGRGDALTRFFDDINTGRIKLTPPGPNMTAGKLN